MKYRILLKKLLFLNHIATLPDTCLAKEMYNIQKELHFPGLVQECEAFLVEHGLSNIEKFTKIQWKKKMKHIIFTLNKDELVAMSKKFKKINFESELYNATRHEYLSSFHVRDARLLFKIRSKMVPTIQMNFPRDKSFASNLWTCSGCRLHRDTQTHVMSCDSYVHLRDGLDLKEDRDLITFFRNLLDCRNKSEKNMFFC